MVDLCRWLAVFAFQVAVSAAASALRLATYPRGRSHPLLGISTGLLLALDLLLSCAAMGLLTLALLLTESPNPRRPSLPQCYPRTPGGKPSLGSGSASSARAAARLPLLPVAPVASTVAEVEVSGVLAEALATAASASAAVFSALKAVSSVATAAGASASSKKPVATATLMSLVTRSSKAVPASDEDRELATLEKMEQLDDCIAEMEAGSDKVFRSIMHTTVALLNIRTQTC